METLRLPARLPGGLNLGALNMRLRAGELRLDWSDVAPETAPALVNTLLAGLTLTEHLDVIGAETVPEELAVTVMKALEIFASQETELKGLTLFAGRPGLWSPPESAEEPAEEGTEEARPELVGTTAAELGEEEVRTPLLIAPSLAEMRDELEELVIRDLLGPAGSPEEEVAEARLQDRYLLGQLVPNNAQVPPEEQESAGTAEEGSEEQGLFDSDSSQTSSLSRSTLGMSFCVSLEASALLVTASWGHYRRTDSESAAATLRSIRVWKRTPRGGQAHPLPLREGEIELWQPALEEQPDVYVKGLMRRNDKCWMVTLFLVNGQALPTRTREQAYLFQPVLSVAAADGGPIFQSRFLANSLIRKMEDRAIAMLYRHQVSFAIGHGVSVHAETRENDPTSAVRLTTTFVPRYELPRPQAPTSAEIPAMAGLCLDMQQLAETPQAGLMGQLGPLVTAYAAWIAEQRSRLDDPAARLSGYDEVAHKALEQCQGTLQRIRAGLDLLASNEQAARAFAFANRAMWLQRIHTLWAEERRRGGQDILQNIDCPANRSWRPFQLAFLLLNLPALTNLEHPERSAEPEALADLLWFPTGGGKTEAYLGLTAYTLGIRRLQGVVEGRSGLDGVAVLMRYTLRLLTLQQFQRAASLICACETIRRSDATTWGSTPFRLGLWVGQASTPNTFEQSKEAIDESRDVRGYSGRSSSPRQLISCPWCGSPIEAGKHLKADPERRRTLMFCGDKLGQCSFTEAKSPGEGLPVLVVDEEIYRLLPSLLIATVDKFAQLPWKGETQMLFGQVDQHCPRHGFRSPEIDDRDSHPARNGLPAVKSSAIAPLRPPDLIIQDELHLISGPLGTLVGLYETAVDALATWTVNGHQVRPKVIAATATIRQAGQQIKRLFLRDVAIFPPQGIDVTDNFFSRQRMPSLARPGRRYLGICAHGKRLKAAQIRVYVAYLSAAQVLWEKYGSAADPWMTLVGYFNSMSQLGGMRRLVDDEVKSRAFRMEKRGLKKRVIRVVEELTSRASSSDIPDLLGRLEIGFTSANTVSKLNKDQEKQIRRPVDVLLATTMISVGVDVKRLGLMVVTGQPKTTAEYIQATSRVGRSFPGLVCVIYNWARPRDLSHFEQFEHYHATFYKHVEALSVTPFAARACDRGLAALLASLVRLAGPTWNKNTSAGSLHAGACELVTALTTITRRASLVSDDPAVALRVDSDLARLQGYWLKEAGVKTSLGYKDQRNGVTVGLLKEPQRGNWEPFTCLNSLRDVEPAVHLILDEDVWAQASVEEEESHG